MQIEITIECRIHSESLEGLAALRAGRGHPLVSPEKLLRLTIKTDEPLH